MSQLFYILRQKCRVKKYLFFEFQTEKMLEKISNRWSDELDSKE